VKHVNHAFYFHRVDGAKGVAVKIRHDFENTSALESFQRFSIGMFAALLSGAKRKVDAI
jgi:hypothetical protein